MYNNFFFIPDYTLTRKINFFKLSLISNINMNSQSSVNENSEPSEQGNIDIGKA